MEKPEDSPALLLYTCFPYEFISPHAQFRKDVKRVFSKMINVYSGFSIFFMIGGLVRIYYVAKKIQNLKFKFCSEGYTSIHV